MALKLKHVIEAPEDVIGPLRDYYTQGDDGKFHLSLDGDPPKLATFRANNIDLMRERDALKARYEGIDPEAVKADKAKLAELEARPDAAKLAADLESEKAANRALQMKQMVTTEFLRSGGYTSAVDFIAGKAAGTFSIENGTLTTKEFSTANPSEPLSLTEWMQTQAVENHFCFQPSRGGGAGGARSKSPATFGARSDQKVLKNPTPQELGANATAIAKGELKIEHS